MCRPAYLSAVESRVCAHAGGGAAATSQHDDASAIVFLTRIHGSPDSELVDHAAPTQRMIAEATVPTLPRTACRLFVRTRRADDGQHYFCILKGGSSVIVQNTRAQGAHSELSGVS